MPLGNLTSQFFANIYLNELDQFVKHKLKAKYYIRYADDFVILHSSKVMLKNYKEKINQFLKQRLDIELHPDKSKITYLDKGINFLGFRIFYYYKLLRKSNIRNMKNKFKILKKDYDKGRIDYDEVYDFFEGWMAYAKHANTHKLRNRIALEIEKNFPNGFSIKEIDKLNKK